MGECRQRQEEQEGAQHRDVPHISPFSHFHIENGQIREDSVTALEQINFDVMHFKVKGMLTPP